MLVLSRKIGEVITIGNNVSITVLSYDRGIVRLGIDAPKNIPVHRKEIHDKIIEMNRMAARTQINDLKFAISKLNISHDSADIKSKGTLTINPDNLKK